MTDFSSQQEVGLYEKTGKAFLIDRNVFLCLGAANAVSVSGED